MVEYHLLLTILINVAFLLTTILLRLLNLLFTWTAIAHSATLPRLFRLFHVSLLFFLRLLLILL